ncbi:Chloroperoxidase [Phlyctochytrium arcticum]|nr:Chloroperoxidase [Phlyctochytrium arcticum]
MHFAVIASTAALLVASAQGAAVGTWKAPSGDEVRSPCPVLNALANHDVLPRNGKDIPAPTYVEALKSIGVAVDLANTLAFGAPATGVPARWDGIIPSYGLDDLRKHGAIEHDGSITRGDDIDGDNWRFNSTLYKQFLTHANPDSSLLDETSFAKVRKQRDAQSLARNPNADSGTNYRIKAYGEAALITSVFGKDKAPDGGNALSKPVADALFVDERLPIQEGWSPRSFGVTILEVGIALKKIQNIAV